MRTVSITVDLKILLRQFCSALSGGCPHCWHHSRLRLRHTARAVEEERLQVETKKTPAVKAAEKRRLQLRLKEAANKQAADAEAAEKRRLHE